MSTEEPTKPDAPAESVTVAELEALYKAMGCHTQSEFAEALGITQGHVSHLFTGRRTLKPGSLMKLVQQLLVEHGVRKLTPRRGNT